MNAPGRLVLVLGMHRSGTSTLARGLRVLGVALGKNLLPAHPCNPKGFFEDAGLYALNKALLAQLGLTWRSPEAPDTAALRRLAGPPGVTALSLLREKSAGQAIPGLKDPRMSRLLPFWRPVLAASGLRAHCCIALRHPESVAHSLWQRDRLDAEHSHALWLAYLLDALEGSAGLPRLLTDYGLLLRKPEHQLQRLGHFLNLPLDPAELTLFADDFLDKTLCHHSPAPANDAVRESPGGAWAALAPAAAASPEHQALDEPRLGRLVASLRREAAATAAPVSQEPRP